MKRSFLFLAAGLILMLASTAAFTQQSQRINYRVTNYFRVAPEKTAAMLQEARTTERKLMQERIASGENIPEAEYPTIPRTLVSTTSMLCVCARGALVGLRMKRLAMKTGRFVSSRNVRS
jgi:hypothetical protein